MKLNEAQSMFKKSILAIDDEPKSIKALKPAGQLTLSQAFDVYHKGYIARFSEELRKTFESTNWVLGENLFNNLCRSYIEAQTSIPYDLAEYGSSFPDFAQDHPTTRGIPFIKDLSQFEWTIKEVQSRATPMPLPVERIQELIHTEDFKVSFIEAMTLFSSPYAVYEIWSHRKDPAYQFESINWNHPENLLIYKKDRSLHIHRIDNIEMNILEELQDGASVTEAFADYAMSLSPERIAQFFQMMMKAGIIDDITQL